MTEYLFKSYGLENYKSIRKSPDIDVGGLTIVLGPNSSGKTNILESLTLLKQSLDQGDISLTLNGDYVDLGEYRDVVHMKDTSRKIGFRFNFQRDSTEGDEEVEYECPICHKEYIRYEGHYTNHLEEHHPRFWEYCGGKYGDKVRKYEDFLISNTSVEIRYKYNEDVKANMFDELRVTNPSPVSGLFISELRLQTTKSGFSVIADDIKGRRILNISAKEEELDIDYPDELSGLIQIIRRILFIYVEGSQDDRMPWQYRYHINHSGEDDEFTCIHEYSNKLEEVYDNTYQQGIGALENYEHGIQALAGGLLGRVSSIAMSQLEPIKILSRSLDEMEHIGPLRKNPQRIYFGSGGSPGQLYSQGENIENMIFKAQQSGESPLIEKTNQWLSECGFDVQLGISEVGFGDLYQLVVEEDGLSVNLADSGFGLSQTLPIIVRAVNMELKKDRNQERSNKGGWLPPRSKRTQGRFMMLIEQPEIHLNPRIEASVGDFFINIIDSGMDLIIETHSEHLLNRIQRRVTDGTIEDSSRISIYFVSKEGRESEIEEIVMDSNGRFENWPAGFFQDDFDEAIEILKESLPD